MKIIKNHPFDSDNPLSVYSAKVERSFRAEGRVAPPVMMMMIGAKAFLSERHPDLDRLSASNKELPMAVAFNDEGDMKISFTAHPEIAFSDHQVDFFACDCGETILLMASISDEDGLRLVLSPAAIGCEHGHTVLSSRPQSSKPASKKRRQRDARKQAA